MCATAALLIAGAGACSSSTTPQTGQSASDGTGQSMGTVAMFVPSDGFTLSNSTPQNTWKALADDTESELESIGMDGGSISVQTASSLTDQTKQLDEYLTGLGIDTSQDQAPTTTASASDTAASDSDTASSDGSDDTPAAATSDNASTPGDDTPSADAASSEAASSEAAPSSSGPASGTTILIAPAISYSNDDKLYGDYVPHDAADSDSVERSDLAKLATLLTKAQDSGASVMLMSTRLEDFSPSVFVDLSSARNIGQLQAQYVVNKLKLVANSDAGAKAVEILLPYDDDTEFVREAFLGIWDVLGPYYRDGSIYSPSGKITASSTDASWRDVAYKASSDDDTKNEITSRLDASAYGNVTTMKLDALICLNDKTAPAAVSTLKSLGYTGTSATINPNTSVTGIIDNIRGNKDVAKSEVPAPSTDAGSKSKRSSLSADAIDQISAVLRSQNDDGQWPLVTGYGAYKSQLPSIVNGTQWMTGIENRKQYASAIAHTAIGLNEGQTTQTLSGQIAALRETDGSNPSPGPAILSISLQGVTADNIKAALIDPGYVSAADADL